MAKRRAQLRAKKVPILLIDSKPNPRSGDYKDFHLVFFYSENGCLQAHLGNKIRAPLVRPGSDLIFHVRTPGPDFIQITKTACGPGEEAEKGGSCGCGKPTQTTPEAASGPAVIF